MIVLLAAEVVFCWVFVSKICKRFSVELSFRLFVLKEKDEEKGEKGIFKFIVLSCASQSLSLPCNALPFI